MILNEEQKEQGRRNFLKVLAGTPALAALGAAVAARGPLRGGPVKAAVIGTGGMGRGLIGQCQKEFIDLRAICDINPKRRGAIAESMVKAGWAEPKQYEKAPPLWARFYDINTNRPIFCGRDGIIKSSLAEIEHERRVGYSWYTNAPAELLQQAYPAWQAKQTPER